MRRTYNFRVYHYQGKLINDKKIIIGRFNTRAEAIAFRQTTKRGGGIRLHIERFENNKWVYGA